MQLRVHVYAGARWMASQWVVISKRLITNLISGQITCTSLLSWQQLSRTYYMCKPRSIHGMNRFQSAKSCLTSTPLFFTHDDFP
jgi:hypothetical protein